MLLDPNISHPNISHFVCGQIRYTTSRHRTFNIWVDKRDAWLDSEPSQPHLPPASVKNETNLKNAAAARSCHSSSLPSERTELLESDRGLKYAFNKRKTIPMSDLISPELLHCCSKRKPEQVGPSLPLRRHTVHPQGGLYSSWQHPVDLCLHPILTSPNLWHTGMMLFVALWNSIWPQGPLKLYLTIKKNQQGIIPGRNWLCF